MDYIPTAALKRGELTTNPPLFQLTANATTANATTPKVTGDPFALALGIYLGLFPFWPLLVSAFFKLNFHHKEIQILLKCPV